MGGVLSFVVSPDSPPVDPMGAGLYSALVMWDDIEWASPTPCCLQWVLRRIAGLRCKASLSWLPKCGIQDRLRASRQRP
jgi:hypothetical protein